MSDETADRTSGNRWARAPVALLDAGGRIVAADEGWGIPGSIAADHSGEFGRSIGPWVVAECGPAFASRWCEVLEGRRSEAIGSFTGFDARGRHRIRHVHVLSIEAEVAGAVAAMFVVDAHEAAWEPSGFLDPTIDALAISDFDGRVVAVSPAMERITGRVAADLLSRPFADFLHPDDCEAARGRLEQWIAGHHLPSYRNRYVRPDGSVRWLQWRASVRVDRRLVFAFAEDVTDSERRASLLAATQRAAAVGGFEIDFATDEVFWTDEMYRLHGVSPREFHPDPASILGFFSGAHRGRVAAALESARDSGAGVGFDFECELETADGTRRAVRLVGDVRSVLGRPALVHGAMQDVTAQRDLEARLVRSHELETIGCTAGDIAHDLANQLTVARAGIDHFAARAGAGADVQAARDLEIAFDRSVALVERLLGIGRRVAEVTGRTVPGSVPATPTPQSHPFVPSPAAAPTPAVAGGPLRVLLVEDDELVRDLMRRSLESLGYAVVVAGDAAAAERCAVAGIDVLVSDIGLPDADGRSLLRRLRQNGTAVPAVLCSGRPHGWRAGELPHCRFLAKPFTVGELDAAVRGALATVGRRPARG